MPLRIRVPSLGKLGGTAYTLTAAAGSFAITGVAAGLKYGRVLTSAKGTFTITGVAAGLKYGRNLPVTVGTYSLTGVAATLRYGHVLTASVGTFTITGVAANLNKTGGYTLTASTGSFAITGVNAGLIAARKMAVTVGAFSITGVAAGLKVGRVVGAGPGAYVITGVNATLAAAVAARLTADTGSFVITGFAANLNYSGARGPATTGAVGGGGGFRDQPSRRGGRGSAKITSAVTEDELREAYERAVGIAPGPAAPQKVRKAVRKAVNVHALTTALAGTPVAPNQVDWGAVLQDNRTVELIFAAYARAMQDEDDAIMALLLAS